MASGAGRRDSSRVSAPTLTALPDQFAAGSTVKYNRTLADYSAADGWVLKLYVAGVDITDAVLGTANGTTWDMVLSAAATAKLRAGTYQWRELVSKSGETYIAASGTVVITPNIATVGAGDLQSFEERMLPIVEAVLAGRIPADAESYQIAGRAVTKIPAKELLEIRDRFVVAIRAQRRAGQFGQTVLAVFRGV
jgi:hypothetical protein